MGSKETQNQMIEEHLRKHGSIEPMEALANYGCNRLAARIWDLRHKGIRIKTINTAVMNRYGRVINFAKYCLERKSS